MKKAGLGVTYNPELAGQALSDKMNEEQPEVLVVRATNVTQEYIDNNESLQLIIRAGTEIDNIDSAHCSTKGIYVANTAD